MNKSKKYPLILVLILFAVCMGLTAGLTMAFFGGTSTGSSTVTLKTGVKVGATATASNDGAMVVPGQPIDISATGTVEPYSSTGTVVPALLRLKFTIGGAMDVTPTLNTTDAMTIKTQSGDATGYWVLHTDGYYYLCAEAAEATVANTQLLKFTPVNTTTEEDKTKVSLTGNFVVPTSLGNEASNQSLDINARFEVIQAEIYADGSDTAIADENLTIGNEAVQEVFGEFATEPVVVNHVGENSVLSSAKFKDGEATLTVQNLEYYEDIDVYGYFVPIQFEGLQKSTALDISFSIIGEVATHIIKGNYYSFTDAYRAVTENIINENCADIIYSYNPYVDTGEMVYDGTTLTINTKAIISPNSNNFTIVLHGAENLTSFDINFTLTEISVDYNNIVITGDDGLSLNLTPNNIITEDGMSMFVYNIGIDNVTADATDAIVLTANTVDGTQLSAGSAISAGWAAINWTNIAVVDSMIEGGYLIPGPSAVIIPQSDTENVFSILVADLEGTLTENSQLNITVKLVKASGVITPEFDENGVATVDYVVTLENPLIYVTLPQLAKEQLITVTAPSSVLEGGEDAFLYYNGHISGEAPDNSDFNRLVTGGEQFTLMPMSTIYYFEVNQETGITFYHISLTFTLTDEVITSIDFAEINSTEGVTKLFNNKSVTGQKNIFEDYEVYNFTITGITQSCTLEITYNETVDTGSHVHEVYIKDSHYITGNFDGGTCIAGYSDLGKITYTLTADQNFDFGMLFTDETLDSRENISLTFKIVTQ